MQTQSETHIGGGGWGGGVREKCLEFAMRLVHRKHDSWAVCGYTPPAERNVKLFRLSRTVGQCPSILRQQLALCLVLAHRSEYTFDFVCADNLSLFFSVSFGVYFCVSVSAHVFSFCFLSDVLNIQASRWWGRGDVLCCVGSFPFVSVLHQPEPLSF